MMLTVTTEDALRAEVERLTAKRDELTRARDEATEQLKDALARLVESGVSEVEAARIVGISRQGLRQWLGKQDRANRPVQRP